MSNPFFDELKSLYHSGSVLIKLLMVNIGLFLAINITGVFFWLFTGKSHSVLVDFLAVPADIHKLINKPWTIITYMFTHVQTLHILFNMLVLYFSGRLFMDFIGPKKLLYVYLLGGITGALFYIVAFNIFPVFDPVIKISTAIGASASVMAILIAIAAYMPNFIVRLFLFGNVPLKYLAIAYVVIDILSIPGSNSGGHIAHLGGAFFGFLFAMQLKRGNDMTVLLHKLLEWTKQPFVKKRKLKIVYSKKVPRDDYEYNAQKVAFQKEIDRILDKIAKSGYDALTKEEKEFLNKASKR